MPLRARLYDCMGIAKRAVIETVVDQQAARKAWRKHPVTLSDKRPAFQNLSDAVLLDRHVDGFVDLELAREMEDSGAAQHDLAVGGEDHHEGDRKSTRLNSSH